MKQSTCNILKGVGMVCLLLCLSIQAGLAQEGEETETGCRNSSCMCGGTTFAGPCAIRRCCRPNIASCKCSFFVSRCSCGPSGGGYYIMPLGPTYEQNILDFAVLLNSESFTSGESKIIADKLPLLITSASNEDSNLYYSTADELEELAKRLPAAEKQLANAWVAARGGTVFLE